MTKYDVKQELRGLYRPPEEFVVVEVPELRYLAVDGSGNPNTADAYRHAVEALYGVAYTLKFDGKKAGRDSVVAPLEGLWRADDPAAFVDRRKDDWAWTMLIHQPPWVTADDVDAAVAKSGAKKANPALDGLRLHTVREGTCVQILHLGSYDDEAPTLRRLHHEYLPEHGLTFNGDHHEIYLSDPRRTDPAKLRTVLRQPVRPV